MWKMVLNITMLIQSFKIGKKNGDIQTKILPRHTKKYTGISESILHIISDSSYLALLLMMKSRTFLKTFKNQKTIVKEYKIEPEYNT